MTFIFLLGLFVLISMFLPWVNLFRINGMDEDVYSIRQRLGSMERELENRKLSGSVSETEKVVNEAASVPEPAALYMLDDDGFLPDVECKERSDNIEVLEEVIDKPLEEADIELETDKAAEDVWKRDVSDFDNEEAPEVDVRKSLEFNIASKLPVWIGSVSLIFAAFFFVKYSIEYGVLTPIVRVSIGGLFGGALLTCGLVISKRVQMANYERISQGLIGAGLVSFYGSIYAAVNLYSLMLPVPGFVCMAIVTASAIVLSLRQGQAIAVFGLVGGLLTPAMIGSDEPNAVALFGYLFLLFTGVFWVLAYKGWWKLATASVCGMFIWTFLWILNAFVHDDALVLILFVIAISGIVIAVTGKLMADSEVDNIQELPLHVLNSLSIAGSVLTITWLGFEVSLSLFDWSMLGILSVAIIVLSYFRPEIYQKILLVKMVSSIILLFFCAPEVSQIAVISVLAGMFAIYAGGAEIMVRLGRDIRYWSGAQVFSAISLYIVSYFLLGLTGTGEICHGLVGMVLTGIAISKAVLAHYDYANEDAGTRDLVVSVYAFAASALLVVAMAVLLPWEAFVFALAAQIAATSAVYKCTGENSLKWIIGLLVAGLLAVSLEVLLLFVQIIGSSLIGEANVLRLVSEIPVIDLTVMALALYVSVYMVLKRGQNDIAISGTLFGVASLFAGFVGYYVFHSVYHISIGDPALRGGIGFIERGTLTLLIAGVGVIFALLYRRFEINAVRICSVCALCAALARIVYFDFFALNPCYPPGAHVGDLVLFNGISMVYGGGGLIALFAALNKDIAGYVKETPVLVFRFIGIACAFAFVSLSVRHFFHGGYLLQGDTGSLEMYMYSAAWLVAGFALLALGIVINSKVSRVASLCFIMLAVGKVFLFDASELEGLYRVFSFLGLGVSLIGLSYFYSRFVFDKQKS